MQEKYNPLKAAELSAEQNYNMIDGVMNNTPPAPVLPEEKPLDKVKEQMCIRDRPATCGADGH